MDIVSSDTPNGTLDIEKDADLVESITFTTAEDVLAALKGQKLVLPDLWNFFRTWPSATNTDLSHIREQVMLNLTDMQSSNCLNAKKVQKLKRADFGLFGAVWWPEAPRDRLQILTDFSMWLFLWDDEIDTSIGQYAFDFEGAQAFRSETLNFVRQCLDLMPFEEIHEAPHPILEFFRHIGTALKEHCGVEQRFSFLAEMEFFMNKSATEQRLALDSCVPSLDVYWRYRMGTSAVTVILAIVQYSTSTELPENLISSPAMARLWDATNAIISIVNDVLSAKKEAADGSILSIIPLLFASSGQLQVATDMALRLLDASIKSFEFAADELLSACAEQPDAQSAVSTVIRTFRYHCTGNLAWSLSTDRYSAVRTENGGIEFQL